MRVLGAVVVALVTPFVVVVVPLVLVRGDVEAGVVGDVEGGVPGLLRRVVDRRLELLEVDQVVGLAHLEDLLRRELEVVGLGAGLGEVGDLHVVAADLRDGVLEGVEGGAHPHLVVVSAATVGAAAAGGHGEEEGGGGDEGAGAMHENDSHPQ